MKTPITQNKYEGKSTFQMLSLNLEYTFLFLNFVITSLFTFAPNPVFLSKKLYTILDNPLSYPSYCGFRAI